MMLVSTISTTAIAKPLDAETCQRLKGDIQGLEQSGVRDQIARGPQAAKGLNAGQLEKIRILMDLDGQVRFRCGERGFVTLKEEPPEEPQDANAPPATIDGATPGITLPPGAAAVGAAAAAGAVVPPVKRRPPPKPPATAATATPTAASAPATPATTPKAKAAAPAAPGPKTAAQEPGAAPKAKAAKAKADDAFRPQTPVAPKSE